MPSLSPACGSGYTPRSYTNDLKDIARDHLEELFSVYDERFRSTYGPMHPRVRELLEAFLRCGDPHFGFLRVRCCNPSCDSKTERIVPFSCKSRGLCCSCSQKRALLWAERMVEEVLPDVPYAQLVFTIPKMLRKSLRRRTIKKPASGCTGRYTMWWISDCHGWTSSTLHVGYVRENFLDHALGPEEGALLGT